MYTVTIKMNGTITADQLRLDNIKHTRLYKCTHYAGLFNLEIQKRNLRRGFRIEATKPGTITTLAVTLTLKRTFNK